MAEDPRALGMHIDTSKEALEAVRDQNHLIRDTTANATILMQDYAKRNGYELFGAVHARQFHLQWADGDPEADDEYARLGRYVHVRAVDDWNTLRIEVTSMARKRTDV